MKHPIFLSLQVATLDPKAMKDLAKQKHDGTRFALFFIILTAITGYIGSILFLNTPWSLAAADESTKYLLGSSILTMFLIFAFIWVASSVAKLFGGEADTSAYFRVAGCGAIVGILNLFPPLGIMSALWFILINFYALLHIHKLKIDLAIASIALAVLVCYIILFFSSIHFCGPFGASTWQSFCETML